MNTFFKNTLALAVFLAAVAAGSVHGAPLDNAAGRPHASIRPMGECAHWLRRRGDSTRKKRLLKIGFIGDSITCGYNQVGNTITPGQNDVGALTVKELSPEHGATVADRDTPWSDYDKGVSATSSADWLPGPSDNLYGRTKAAFITAFGEPDPKRNPVWIMIMLGTNDVRSDRLFPAARHGENLQAIVSDLVSSGFNVVLNHAPSFVAPTSFNGVTWDAAALALLQSYVPAEKNVADSFAARAPRRVFLGDTSAAGYFAVHPALFQEYGVYGGLHPNGAGGTAALADCWAAAFRRIIKSGRA